MKRFISGLSLMCLSAVSHADIFGLLNSRTADVAAEPQMTVEGGLSLESDFRVLGAQLNYKISPDLLAYGTLASIKPDYADGDISFGGGVVYQLKEEFLAGMNMAVKGSFHTWSADGTLSNTSATYDVSALGVDLIISPREQDVFPGMKVFGLLGLHRVSNKFSAGGSSVSDSDMEIALGAGAIKAVGQGEAYVAVEIVDELFIGGGYRLALGR